MEDDEVGRRGWVNVTGAGDTGAGGGEGHQLCLPADPNTLGFFATEGLKVHPTRSPRPNGNTNKQEHDKRKQ